MCGRLTATSIAQIKSGDKEVVMVQGVGRTGQIPGHQTLSPDFQLYVQSRKGKDKIMIIF